MKKSLLLLCVLMVIALQGCVTPRYYISGVQLGMTPDEVREIMGTPFAIRGAKVYETGEVFEVWEYVPPIFSMAAISDDYDKSYWIFFSEGKVVQWGEPGDFSGADTISGQVPVKDFSAQKQIR